MGCPKWTGVSLAEILRMAGVRNGAVHVAFFGVDRGPLPTIPPVVRSIPMAKAMERHTMIATGMNGETLTPVHGAPMRSLVPGWVGSASIKWVTAIEVLPAPFKGTYMDDSYRVPGTPVSPGEKMPADAISTEDWPVKSMITFPGPNARYRRGQVVPIEGRAWVGDSSIRRVDLSFDEGATWQRASLGRPARPQQLPPPRLRQADHAMSRRCSPPTAAPDVTPSIARWWAPASGTWPTDSAARRVGTSGLRDAFAKAVPETGERSRCHPIRRSTTPNCVRW